MAQLKVLVVEDDPLIRMLSAEVLTDAGLTVIEADTADAGLLLLTSMADEVAVIFSDIETPGDLNGIDLARRVEQLWPGLPVVLTSGRRLPHPDDPCAARFVGKPYDHNAVAEMLLGLARTRGRA